MCTLFEDFSDERLPIWDSRFLQRMREETGWKVTGQCFKKPTCINEKLHNEEVWNKTISWNIIQCFLSDENDRVYWVAEHEPPEA
ncbi:MAG: hypothetical protein ACRERU_00260 [Methylococcales bacterium]